MSEETITNEGSAAKYFAQIMHMCDDDFGPYEYRLYGHYVRVTGGGEKPCTQSVRTIARITRMSIGKVVESRYTLATMGFVEVHTEEHIDGVAVTIIDRWLENIQRYRKDTQRSSDEQSDDNRSPGEHPVHDMNTPRSPDEPKNNLLDKENLWNIKDSLPLPFDDLDSVPVIAASDDAAVGGDNLDPAIIEQIGEVLVKADRQQSTKVKRIQSKPRERDRIFDGVALMCWGIDAKSLDATTKAQLGKESGRIGKLVKWFKEQDATADQLWLFGQWYKRKHNGINMPRTAETMQPYWVLWKQAQIPVVVVQPIDDDELDRTVAEQYQQSAAYGAFMNHEKEPA